MLCLSRGVDSSILPKLLLSVFLPYPLRLLPYDTPFKCISLSLDTPYPAMFEENRQFPLCTA